MLAALFAVMGHSPAQARMERARDSIIADADAASSLHDVPVELLLVVGYLETHLGTDAGEGGGWGAPIDRRHRHTAGTAATAARVLRTSFAVCGSWRGAVSRFRSGLCRPPGFAVDYVRRAMSISARVCALAALPCLTTP